MNRLMNRWLAIARAASAAAAAILAVSFVWAQELENSPVTKSQLPPFDNLMTIHYLDPGAEAVAAVIGDGGTALGYYAYDAQGRCVAFDDQISPIIDDRSIVWRVVSPEPYELHLRNFGSRFNRVEASFRSVR